MKGQTYLILSIIFIIIIAAFSVLNVSEVEVNYLFWSGSSPLIFVILFSVLLGGILTTVVGSMKYISLRKENKLLRKKLAEFEVNAAIETGPEIETNNPNEETEEINENHDVE